MNVESVSATTSILQRLRAETRPHHNFIETALERMSDAITLGTYHQTLARFHGFYRPLEVGMQSVGGWADRGPDFAGRRKTQLLEADLRALSVGYTAELLLCTDLPPHATVATVATAFDCLSMLEGATLDRHVISRALEKSLGITPQAGGQFFYGYGERTGKMWQVFGAALTSFAVTPYDHDEIVSAAKDTFTKLHRWNETGGRHQ